MDQEVPWPSEVQYVILLWVDCEQVLNQMFHVGCFILPGSHAEKWLLPSRLMQMATAGRVWSSFANGK